MKRKGFDTPQGENKKQKIVPSFELFPSLPVEIRKVITNFCIDSEKKLCIALRLVSKEMNSVVGERLKEEQAKFQKDDKTLRGVFANIFLWLGNTMPQGAEIERLELLKGCQILENVSTVLSCSAKFGTLNCHTNSRSSLPERIAISRVWDRSSENNRLDKTKRDLEVAGKSDLIRISCKTHESFALNEMQNRMLVMLTRTRGSGVVYNMEFANAEKMLDNFLFFLVYYSRNGRIIKF
jgi:hypothetical protein